MHDFNHYQAVESCRFVENQANVTRSVAFSYMIADSNLVVPLKSNMQGHTTLVVST
jgi:hypothetical protein